MKNFSMSFLIFSTFLILTAFRNDDTEKLIARKWKLDEKSVGKALEKVMKSMKEKNPELYEQLNANKTAVEESIRNTTVEYKSDGTSELITIDGTRKGKWSLSQDKKTLTTVT